MNITLSVPSLSQEQRYDALENARKALLNSIGKKPERNQFILDTYTKYPIWRTRLITGLCIIVLVGAFLPSSFRLYVAGSIAFAHGVDNLILAIISGIATVIMAEAAQVVASLAMAIYGTTKWSKRILYAIMCMSTSLALIGNWHVARPYDVFSIVEALFPPLLVLGMS